MKKTTKTQTNAALGHTVREVVLRFWDSLNPKETFNSLQLSRYFQKRNIEVAPDSPNRMLRKLRQEGIIDYVVTNRATSEFQALK